MHVHFIGHSGIWNYMYLPTLGMYVGMYHIPYCPEQQDKYPSHVDTCRLAMLCRVGISGPPSSA